VNTVSDKVVRHSLAYLSAQKWLVGDVPLKVNFPVKVNHPLARERMPASHADKQRNTTHIYFASQRLQCSMKFMTTPI